MISLWNNQETNNYFLINNETGQSTKVTKTGEYIKEFDAALTGQVGYADRCRLAKKPGYMPMKAASLNTNFKDYTPGIVKIHGYTQCPRTVKLPQFQHFHTAKRPTQQSTNKSFLSKNSRTVPMILNSNDTNGMQSLLEPGEMRSISTLQHMDLNDQEHFKEMSKLYDSKSYDYASFNSPQRYALDSKMMSEFENDLKLEKLQLELFKLPEAKKVPVNTKGRFNVQLNSAKQLFQEDRLICKLLYPDMYKEKTVDVAQEQLKKKINILKEREMLARNLKNKL